LFVYNTLITNYIQLAAKSTKLLPQLIGIIFFTARCTICKASSCDRLSSVCLSVRLSVCNVGGSGSHRLEILETNCTDK